MATPPKKIDPRDLMETALRIIKEELAELKEASLAGKLDPDNTMALIRYSDALVRYVKDGLKQREDEQSDVKKLSTEELVKEAAELAQKAKK
jgi:ribosomal protein L29